MMQQAPRHYGERRTEYIQLKDDHHYGVRVVQQLTVPTHADHGSDSVEQELLVPLGEFAKDRLPDLTVTAPDGQLLPVLGRAARGEAVATLYTSRWPHIMFKDLVEAHKEEAAKLWRLRSPES